MVTTPALSNALRSTLVVLILGAPLVTAAQAVEFPGQQEAPLVITSLVERAGAYWRTQGVHACPSGVTAWQADDLTQDGGSAWGRGDGATCEIWLSSDLVWYAALPIWLGNAIEACTAVTHEVGHAYGLGHTTSGVMAGSGAPERMYGWSPGFCFRWARFQLAALLRGNGETERTIKRMIRADMRLIRQPA